MKRLLTAALLFGVLLLGCSGPDVVDTYGRGFYLSRGGVDGCYLSYDCTVGDGRAGICKEGPYTWEEMYHKFPDYKAAIDRYRARKATH